MSTTIGNFRLPLTWLAVVLAWLPPLAATEGQADVRLAAAGDYGSPLLAEVIYPPATYAERAAKFRDLMRRAGAGDGDISVEQIHGSRSGNSNICVILPGSDHQAEVLLFGAHLDAYADSLGAIDNWSGAVMLASLYAHCRRQSFRHTLMFVGFAEEENGLIGARDFLARRSAKAKAAIRAMINLECLGAGPPLVWANRSSDRLEAIFRLAASQAQTPLRRQVLFGYQTDAFVFDRAGIPNLTIHSLSPSLLWIINSSADTPEHLRMRWYRAAFRLLAASVHILDQEVDFSPFDGERQMRPIVSVLPEAVREKGNVLRIGDLPRSSAEWQSGLRPGDVLLAFGDASVASGRALMGLLLSQWQGKRVTLLVKREQRGQTRLLELEVGY